MQNPPSASVLAAAFAVGARRVSIAEVEREFRLPPGKLARGATIETVARASPDDDETSLAAAAATSALRDAGISLAAVDLLLATSETCVGFPQLGAHVHARMDAPSSLGVMDIGGACMGLVNAFVIAKGLLESGAARRVLLVTADVHSRLLSPEHVAGHFGGLFGDGASAFVLQAASSDRADRRYVLGEWFSGGSGAYAKAIQIKLGDEGKLAWSFEGEALARAAVERLEGIVTELEMRSGSRRTDALAFATHQPNPRLVDLLARQLDVPADKFPSVARHYGNLGSSTCGVALALSWQKGIAAGASGPIFLASLAPGLLWSGMVLHRRKSHGG